MRRTISILALFIVLMLPVGASAETAVSDCSTLSTSGETYVLTQDIIDSSATICMNIAANNVTLDCQGHRIDGTDRMKSGSRGVAKNYYSAGANLTIKNCVISDYYIGVYVNKGDTTTATGNRIDNVIQGILLQVAPHSVVADNEITGYMLEAVTLRRSHYTSVTNNKIHDSTGSYLAKGIATDYDGNHLLIQDNEIKNFTGWGIYLYNLFDGGNDVISRNVIRNAYYGGGQGGGIFVMDMLGDEIKNNLVESNEWGILTQGAFFTVSENEISKTLAGIGLDWVWSQVPQTGPSTIQNNTVHDSNQGIYIASNGNLISANTLSNNREGIFLYVSDGNQVRNNTISGSQRGIDHNQSSNTIIAGNTITDSTTFGMWFVLGNGNVVTGNTVCGSGYMDMYVDPGYLPTGYSASGNKCQTSTGWHDDGVASGCTLQCLNHPPVAEAGPNQTVQCTGSGASVRLDGSGSKDPDNDPLKYAWTWQGGSAEGVSPLVTMPFGNTLATLSVDDGKGGTGSDTVFVTVQDTIPPATTVRSIAGIAGDNGWYRSDVAISVESTDTCAGVKEITSTVDGAANVIAGSTATISVSGDLVHSVSFGATDNAGNRETSQAATIKIDQTVPRITAHVSPAPNAAGWNNADVTITYTCSDDLSGIAICPEPVTVSTEGAGQVITRTGVDRAGNTASASVTLNIDKSAPVADILVTPGLLWPPNHKMVNVAVNGGTSDTGSGVASVVITVTDEYGKVQPTANGFNTTLPLEAWREGTDMDGRHYTITAVIMDKAGNSTTVSTQAVCPHDMGNGN